MPSPIRLNDTELDVVFSAARPLPVELRDPFLQAVADALASRGEVGPGVVYQVCREQQRRFFDPPNLDRGSEVNKYSRTMKRGHGNAKYG
jgi:hypothetical protein